MWIHSSHLDEAFAVFVHFCAFCAFLCIFAHRAFQSSRISHFTLTHTVVEVEAVGVEHLAFSICCLAFAIEHLGFAFSICHLAFAI